MSLLNPELNPLRRPLRATFFDTAPASPRDRHLSGQPVVPLPESCRGDSVLLDDVKHLRFCVLYVLGDDWGAPVFRNDRGPDPVGEVGVPAPVELAFPYLLSGRGDLLSNQSFAKGEY